MENLDEVRVPYGTVADFSNWNVGTKGFEHMKVKSSEKVIGQDIEEELMNKLKQVKEEPVLEADLSQLKSSEKKEMPGKKEGMINPAELKSIAVRLLPPADKVPLEEYDNVCEKAIDLAFNFLKVWDLKIQIE